jgi:mono/diheme cytochrome c family protein
MQFRLFLLFLIPAAWPGSALESEQPVQVDFTGTYSRSVSLTAGKPVEISVGLPAPSRLPANGRIAIEFAGYRKVLHALDPDFYMVYQAEKSGAAELIAVAVEMEEPVFNLPRWREPGTIQKIERFPAKTPWPAGARVPLRVEVRAVDFGTSRRGMVIETEPNDSIETAQPIRIGSSGGEETLHITGGADDIEYFDNGKVGSSGLDWFRIEFQGTAPKLFTANLVVTDPLVVAQVLFYTADGKEYREGANANERVHQQTEGHRTEINRTLQPGGVYFLKVEANSPGYDVELRLRQPGPFQDPRQAVRMAMYDHLAQVDAWLLNRPRGASVERRIRDTGSLLGTHCMSCHTQSGVWGPAGAMANGYRPENVANLRHLVNVMYESLRPTNVLQDAANNTSLAPLDLGDGPAGTRVAGYNVTTAESVIAPQRLHSAQQVRTANFVLQSADPSGVNAAGPGSNVGQAVVYRFAGEILRRAWEQTRDDRYLRALEEKAEKLLGVEPKYSDDLSNRIEFFVKTFPANYVSLREESDAAKSLWVRAQAQIETDGRRLRSIQKEDGSWGFHPGITTDGGVTWKNGSDAATDIDPSPTALALTALAALGANDGDPAVKRGVDALLKMQDPYGRWNRNALTGFVSTAYSLHALSRLYPETPRPRERSEFEPRPGESLADTVARFRALAQLGFEPDDSQFLDLILPGAVHPAAQVRYWAQIALGGLHNERGIPAQLKGLGDPVKMVREAARWGIRQTLLDDKGWDHLFALYGTADDLTRESIAGALIMRADGVLTHSGAGYRRVGAALDRMMNQDPGPGVRAWATRAAWNWWIWNPPVRLQLNQAFLNTLDRQEDNALVETAKRFQTEALFIANGQRANGSKEHQYPELAQLFDAIIKRLAAGGHKQLEDRLTRVAATYYSMAGGDGGPGQMGYITPNAAEMVGKGLLSWWAAAEAANDPQAIRLAVEASANATWDPLQKKVLAYSTNGPEDLRTLAATSLSDPRLIALPGTQEFLEPLMAQIQRGAQEPERREELAGSLITLFSRARWNLPKTEEQQRIFYSLLVPAFPPQRGAAPENSRVLAQMDKDPADWYLARSIGRVIHSNPDLHLPALLDRFPKAFATPMDEMLWLPSIKWLLTYDKPIPEVRKTVGEGPDPIAEVRERSVALYLKQLTDPNVDSRLRNRALALAADTRVNTDPRIRPILEKVKPEYVEPVAPEAAALSPTWKANFDYFRMWVAPELTRTNRDDELACLGCHGVAGRVPSMPLLPADDDGYLSAKALYSNYMTLLERVNEKSVESSKLLRKPLNVQSGTEDGHQGGRRFNPGDRGYEILRRWVFDVAALKQSQLALK